jgi:hypothetical protein
MAPRKTGTPAEPLVYAAFVDEVLDKVLDGDFGNDGVPICCQCDLECDATCALFPKFDDVFVQGLIELVLEQMQPATRVDRVVRASWKAFWCNRAIGQPWSSGPPFTSPSRHRWVRYCRSWEELGVS